MQKKIMGLIGLSLLSLNLWSFQSDLYFPWVTNQPQFRSTIVINNLNGESVQVVLNARRQETAGKADGDTEQVTLDIGPFEQLVMDAGSIFTNLGDGGGYAVHLTSSAGNIQAGLKLTGTESPSGSSPAQADVVQTSSAANILLFNFLSISNDGFSAPVIVNTSTLSAQVTYYAFQNGMIADTETRTVAPGHPLALLTSALFPDLTGDLYVVVESDRPLVGTAFIFNGLIEPSMSGAVPLAAVPNPDTGGGGVSFMDQIVPIFTQSCGSSACHTNGGASSGLNLDPANAYGELVNADAIQSSKPRVDPGNAENSYLIDKLRGTGVGARMPNGRPALSEDTIQLIVTWINEGAADN